ncbi:MAG: GNAT family N-acetyltransferase [Defluviitaleaceae bacterium]|nr:GNAT family N-acetyltransferase [Defluviitaleaceae bacterium]
MEIDLRNTQIKTDRLLMRPWMESDLVDFFAYASIPTVGEMAGWKAHATMEAALAFLRSDWFRRECLALFHLADKKVIGSFGLHKSWAAEDKRFRRLTSADIGYVLHPDYWGHGLAAEATTAMIDHAFAYMDMDLLTCAHFSINHQSQRVIEKCGFVFDHQTPIYAEELDMHFEHN